METKSRAEFEQRFGGDLMRYLLQNPQRKGNAFRSKKTLYDSVFLCDTDAAGKGRIIPVGKEHGVIRAASDEVVRMLRSNGNLKVFPRVFMGLAETPNGIDQLRLVHVGFPLLPSAKWIEHLTERLNSAPTQPESKGSIVDRLIAEALSEFTSAPSGEPKSAGGANPVVDRLIDAALSGFAGDEKESK